MYITLSLHAFYMHFTGIWRRCNTKLHVTACNSYMQLCVILHEILQLEIIQCMYWGQNIYIVHEPYLMFSIIDRNAAFYQWM